MKRGEKSCRMFKKLESGFSCHVDGMNGAMTVAQTNKHRTTKERKRVLAVLRKLGCLFIVTEMFSLTKELSLFKSSISILYL